MMEALAAHLDLQKNVCNLQNDLVQNFDHIDNDNEAISYRGLRMTCVTLLQSHLLPFIRFRHPEKEDIWEVPFALEF